MQCCLLWVCQLVPHYYTTSTALLSNCRELDALSLYVLLTILTLWVLKAPPPLHTHTHTFLAWPPLPLLPGWWCVVPAFIMLGSPLKSDVVGILRGGGGGGGRNVLVGGL